MAMLLSGCAHHTHTDNPPAPQPIDPYPAYYVQKIAEFDTYGQKDIAFLGDSLTEHGEWETNLGTPVNNFGIGGDDSTGGLSRIEQVIKTKPAICFILFGANEDMSDTSSNNIKATHDQLCQAGIFPVVQTVPYVTNVYPEHEQRNATRKTFNARLRSSGMDILDLNKALDTNGSLDPSISVDGLHLNAQGYAIWYPLIKDFMSHNCTYTPQDPQ